MLVTTIDIACNQVHIQWKEIMNFISNKNISSLISGSKKTVHTKRLWYTDVVMWDFQLTVTCRPSQRNAWIRFVEFLANTFVSKSARIFRLRIPKYNRPFIVRFYRARYISNGFLYFPQNKDNNEALFSQHNIVIINIYFPKWTRKWNP